MRTKFSRSIVTSVVLSLMMALAMMPGIAFATSVEPGYDIAIQNPGPVTTADNLQLTANVTKPADASATHVEWSSDNATVATIGKNKGTLAIKSAGTVVITAELRSGDSTGGGGTGTGGSSGEILATDSLTLNITKADYGFQGLGGNGLMMKDPSDITVLTPGTLDGKTKYNNTIDSAVEAVDGVISFGYTMSAGMNNFKESTFNTYKDQINIYDASGENIVAPITFGGFSNQIVTIKADMSDEELEEGEYILRFGPSVCGNNTEKKLNCYIDFTFELVK